MKTTPKGWKITQELQTKPLPFHKRQPDGTLERCFMRRWKMTVRADHPNHQEGVEFVSYLYRGNKLYRWYRDGTEKRPTGTPHAKDTIENMVRILGISKNEAHSLLSGE